MQSCLVVDDSSVIRKVATRIVGRFGITAADAATGAEALEMLDTLIPDFVLVAATLPDMGTDEFVRRLRAVPALAGTKAIALLVEGNLGLMTRLKRAGVDGFAYKPFNRESLMARLEPHIRLPEAA